MFLILVLSQDQQVAIPQNRPSNMQVAPVSGNNAGIRRAEIKAGIREVITCKDAEGKIGLRIRHVNSVSNLAPFCSSRLLLCFTFKNNYVYSCRWNFKKYTH